MWGYALTIVFLYLSGLSISLRKFYLESPVIEPANGPANPALRRRSVKSTKREHILSGLLIGAAVICFGLFALMLLAYVPRAVYLSILVLALFFVFFYLPGKNSGRFVMEIARVLTPAFIALLTKTKNQTKNLEKYFSQKEKLNTTHKHLTKVEILEILNQQKISYDGRNLQRGLNMAINSVGLGSKQVGDFMAAIHEVHLVGADETAGPILIDELHKSGRSVFPVNNKDQEIIGMVRLPDLVELSQNDKRIEDAMSNEPQYLYEDDNVVRALESFISTGATMYIVKNASKNSGVLYIEDLIAKMIES